ncbi:MAG: shikimate dehydrogenase, partial [Opitutae bacterium]
DKSVVIFGAGGAARAIGVEVALAGASAITIVNRSPGRGEELTSLLDDKLPVQANFVLWDKTFVLPAGTDVLINATSIGLFPDVDARLDFDLESLSS